MATGARIPGLINWGIPTGTPAATVAFSSLLAFWIGGAGSDGTVIVEEGRNTGMLAAGHVRRSMRRYGRR